MGECNEQCKYIYLNNNSISPELCDIIINYFENEQNVKYEGVTSGGLQKNVKKTIDMIIPSDHEKWKHIKEFLDEELSRNVKDYVEKINQMFTSETKRSYFVFANFLAHDTFMIQKYNKNDGKFTFHDDFRVDWQEKKYRVITYLWYLNTVEEGGETEIWNNFLVKPEKGKLLLFPASWTFPHRGKMPISDNKYIITGWLYVLM